jgi:hypothetical protein
LPNITTTTIAATAHVVGILLGGDIGGFTDIDAAETGNDQWVVFYNGVLKHHGFLNDAVIRHCGTHDIENVVVREVDFNWVDFGSFAFGKTGLPVCGRESNREAQ